MNLVEVSRITRQAVKVVIALVILILIYRITKPLAVNLYKSLIPEKDPPTIKWGNLPALKFVEKSVRDDGVEYELNTETGRLPSGLPTKLPVYKTTEPSVTLQQGKKAQLDALQLGFSDDDLYSDLRDTIFEWRNISTGSNLTIDSITKEVFLITQIPSLSNLISPGLTEQLAITNANRVLSNIGRPTGDLYKKNSQTNVSLGFIRGNSIIATDESRTADVARVDYFRNMYTYQGQNYPILGPDPKKGLINVYITKPNINEKVVGNPIVEYHEWQILQDNTATYPLISVGQAWNEVSKGNGVIVNVTPRGDNNLSTYNTVTLAEILINEIYIAYYDTEERQEFIQPIYVFEGNYSSGGTTGGDITIYFPAVQGEYVIPPQSGQN